MKKLILLFVGVLIATSAAFSQGTLAPGKAQLDAGVGFSTYTTPFYIGFDYGLKNNMTVGAELSYRDRNNYWRVISITGNWNFHFNKMLKLTPEWDLYAGLKAGYLYYDTYAGYELSETNFYAGGQVGGRWFFTDNFGLNVELAVGNSFSDGRLGITYKF